MAATNSKLGLGSKLASLLPRKDKRYDSLTEGLERLNNRLGFHNEQENDPNKPHPLEFTVEPTIRNPRGIFYAPDMDGQVDPGEVVWFWAPACASATRTANTPETERALVVIGRHHDEILGLLTSADNTHSGDVHWLDIGAGPWEESGKQAWVRLDRLIRIPEHAIRRQGAVIPQGRFERIAIRLRKDYGWV